MKKFILGCASLFLAGGLMAADLEATVVDSEMGGSTGEIDLNITGGVAPFVVDWVGPAGFTSSDEDLSGLAPGVYTVTVTDTYCGTATLEVEVIEDDNSSLAEEEPDFTLSIYPNPTAGILFLKSNKVIDVVVYNVVGERVMAAQNVQQIDLSNQPAGIYMVQVSSEAGTITRKVTLQ